MDRPDSRQPGRGAASAAAPVADHPSPGEVPARVPPALADRRPIWLASYPRSGNTSLRAVLNHCLGLPATSVHGGGDLGRNPVLERYAGHYAPGGPEAGS